jgi:hypothetical protein
MTVLDHVGASIERALDRIERDASAHWLGSLVLGSALALTTVVAGFATFILVLVALVRLFA